MTTKELRKLKHGTKVLWKPDTTLGYVVTNHRQKHPNEDVYIQWEDSQRTIASDDAALEYVELFANQPPA